MVYGHYALVVHPYVSCFFKRFYFFRSSVGFCSRRMWHKMIKNMSHIQISLNWSTGLCTMSIIGLHYYIFYVTVRGLSI